MQAHNTLTVLGGIGNGGAISRESDIVLFATTDSRIQMLQRLTLSSSNITSQSPWPLLVGSSVFLTRNGYIAIISGAATCFSMGTFCKFTSPLYPARCARYALLVNISRRDSAVLAVVLSSVMVFCYTESAASSSTGCVGHLVFRRPCAFPRVVLLIVVTQGQRAFTR